MARRADPAELKVPSLTPSERTTQVRDFSYQPLLERLKSTIVRTVNFCTRYAWWVILAGTTLGVLSTAYAAKHFAITTDINRLISDRVGRRKARHQGGEIELWLHLDDPAPIAGGCGRVAREHAKGKARRAIAQDVVQCICHQGEGAGEIVKLKLSTLDPHHAERQSVEFTS